jgi:hypothetical protein
MSKLIDEFKKEHALVASHLSDARKHGIESKEGRVALEKAKAALLGHLKKEDQHLYPALQKAAATDRRLSWLLEIYARDMQEVSTAALSFFEKYATGGKGFESNKDFGTLLARLNLRIGNEENELYKEYDKLNLPESMTG